MQAGRTVHFLTYADHNYGEARTRVHSEAVGSGWFDEFHALGPDDLEGGFRSKFAHVLAQPRLGGYCIWKPYVVSGLLDRMGDGDFLVYLDAGCTINKRGAGRFAEYIALLEASRLGCISFELPNLERWWTSDQIFDYFGVEIDSQFANSPQYLATVLIMQKTEHALALVDEWLGAVHKHVEVFTDAYHADDRRRRHEFRENRHDQSVFSLIRKLRGSVVIPRDETWLVPFGSGFSFQFPFWATRRRQRLSHPALDPVRRAELLDTEGRRVLRYKVINPVRHAVRKLIR